RRRRGPGRLGSPTRAPGPHPVDRGRPPVPPAGRRGAHRGRGGLDRLRSDGMSMLSLIVFLPLAAAAVLAAVPAIGPAAARWAWIAVSVLEVLLVAVVWAG